MSKDSLQSEHCAEMLKAFSEPLRLRIIDALRDGPKRVSKLVDLLGVEFVTVSHHLGILRKAGLVRAKKQGRFVEYSLPAEIFRKSDDSSPTEFIDLGCCRLEIPKHGITLD